MARAFHLGCSIVLWASGAGASAQRAAPAWLDLAQMPVAVARLELAGLPAADLRALVAALDARSVAPARFLETVRGLPLLASDGSTSGYLRQLQARGLRGPALVEAIAYELRRRGVAQGPRHPTSQGVDVLSPAFLLGNPRGERRP